jgi:hypothetical protein
MKLAAAIIALAASAAALAPADRVAIDRAVAGMYRPYTIGAASAAVWQRPIFARDTAALIARWQRVMPQGELDGLNDGDWLCLCQDWDHARFRVTTLGRQTLGPGAAEVRLAIQLGNGQRREARLRLLREAAGWRIDDLFASDFPRGLKQALRETIAEDEKLPK